MHNNDQPQKNIAVLQRRAQRLRKQIAAIFVALLAFLAMPASGLFQSKCLAQDVDIEYFAVAVKCHQLSNMQAGGVDNVYFAFTAGPEGNRKKGGTITLKAGDQATPNTSLWKSRIGIGKQIVKFFLVAGLVESDASHPHIGEVQLEVERAAGGVVKATWIPEKSSHASMQDLDHPEKAAPDTFLLDDSGAQYTVKLRVKVEGKHVKIPVH